MLSNEVPKWNLSCDKGTVLLSAHILKTPESPVLGLEETVWLFFAAPLLIDGRPSTREEEWLAWDDCEGTRIPCSVAPSNAGFHRLSSGAIRSNVKASHCTTPGGAVLFALHVNSMFSMRWHLHWKTMWVVCPGLGNGKAFFIPQNWNLF